MRSHQQSNRDDIASEIAESVQVVLQVSRFPEGRAIHEVIAVQGYDRTSKTFQVETVYCRDDQKHSKETDHHAIA